MPPPVAYESVYEHPKDEEALTLPKEVYMDGSFGPPMRNRTDGRPDPITTLNLIDGGFLTGIQMAERNCFFAVRLLLLTEYTDEQARPSVMDRNTLNFRTREQ